MTERTILTGILAQAASDGHSLETRIETEKLADFLLAHGISVGGESLDAVKEMYNQAVQAQISLQGYLGRLTERHEALLRDIREHLIDTCLICKHNKDTGCDMECDTCETPCMCKGCWDEQKWEWRGI